MNRTLGLVILMTGLAGPSMAQSERATLLAGACQGCHGVAGSGASGIPAIQATMTRSEFVAAMQEFRADRRQATVMGRIARGYTDAEFDTLATVYARPEARQ